MNVWKFLGSSAVLLFFFVCNTWCVEEGWRQHGSLSMTFPGKCKVDFAPVHAKLSDKVELGGLLGNGSAKKDGGEFRLGQGRCYAAASISLVFTKEDESLHKVETVNLSPDLALLEKTQFMSSNDEKYGLVFVSGGVQSENMPQDDKGDKVQDDSGLRIVVFPPFNPSINKHEPLPVSRLPVRLCATDKEDAQALMCRTEKDIRRRWDDRARSFLNGNDISSRNFRMIADIHKQTERRIEKHRISLEFLRELKHDESNEFLSKPLNELIKDTSFLTNKDANNYLCAEQCLFDFLRYCNVVENIRFLVKEKIDHIGRNPSFVVMNVCSTYSPCHHCSTSWVREIEESGAFFNIFDGWLDGVSLRLVVSCHLPYTGRDTMGYDRLVSGTCKRGRETEGDVFSQSYDMLEVFPYPVVCLKGGSADASVRFTD